MKKLMEQLENIAPNGDFKGMKQLKDFKGFKGMDLKIEGLDDMGKKFKGMQMWQGGNGSSSRMLQDNKGSITLKKDQEGSTLRAEDADGNLLYEGPADTDADKAAIPEDIMQRAKGLFPKKKM